MTRTIRASLLALWTFAAWSMTVGGASAYIDGGSTAVIFQALVAGIAAAGTFLALFRDKVKAFFFRKNHAEEIDHSPAGVDVADVDQSAV